RRALRLPGDQRRLGHAVARRHRRAGRGGGRLELLPVRHRAAAEGLGSPVVFPLNVPNVLTLLRILLVPVLVVALLDKTPNGDLVAAFVFAFASATDFVDGWLARSRDSVTTFGKLMDPIADKLLIIAAPVSLVPL